MFPDVVDVKQKSLENEKVYGIPGISTTDWNEQGARTDEARVSH